MLSTGSSTVGNAYYALQKVCKTIRIDTTKYSGNTLNSTLLQC